MYFFNLSDDWEDIVYPDTITNLRLNDDDWVYGLESA
jgi:hypothetical protein